MTINPLISNVSNDKDEKNIGATSYHSFRSDRILFIATLIIDTLFLLTAMIRGWEFFTTALIAGAIMVPYCLLAFQHAKKTGAYERLGDSCYYLGFLLTLIGLSISLYELGLGKEGGVEAAVVARFGAAIVTTLVGMMFRIFIAHFNFTMEQSSEEAGARVSESMFRVANELEASVKQFENIRRTTVNNINQATKAAEARMNAAVDVQIKITERFSTEAIKRHELILDNLEKNLSNVVIDTTPLQASLAEFMQAIETQMMRLNDILSRLGDAGLETEQKWSGLKGRLDVIATSLEAFCNRAENLQNAANNLQLISQRVSEAATAFDGTKQAVGGLSNSLRSCEALIEQVNSDINANVADLQTLRNMVIDEHSAAAEATEEVYARLTKSLELINYKLAQAEGVSD